MAEMVLDRLRHLQEADQELRRLEAHKAAHDRAARVKADQIRSQQEHIESIRKRRHDARVKVNLKELEVRQKRDEITRLKGQQLQIKDNRQFQILQNEIKFAELSISKIEDEILNDYEDIEAVEAEIREAENDLQRHNQELETLRREIEAKKESVDAEIQAGREKRDAIAAALPRDIVSQFDRIADRLDGEALASVLRDEEGTFICGGCHMSITQNTYVLLRGRSDRLFTCPNCTRILFVED